MNNILTPPKQPAQQEAPMHRAAPAGANLTNARTGGMVAPRGYAEGTPSVPGPDNDARYLDPSANARGQLRLNSDGTLGGGYQPAVLSGQNWPGRSAPVPVVPAGQDAPTFQSLPAGRGFGASAGQDFNSRNTFAPPPGPQVIAASDPLSHMAGRGLPSVPLSVPHAQGMLDAALGAPAASADSSQTASHPPQPGQTIHVYGHHPEGGMSDTLYTAAPDGHWIASPGDGAVGSPEHAVANPHAYSPEGFHAALHGMSIYQAGLLLGQQETRARIGQMHAASQHAGYTKELTDLLSQQQLSPADKQRLVALREGLGMTIHTGVPVEYDEFGNVKP